MSIRMRKSKLKINTAGKQYALHDSPFYKLMTKRKLASLLGVDLVNINSFRSGNSGYKVFELIGESGKPRTIEHPSKKLDTVHTRIASLLCRIETPDFLHSGRKGRSHVTNALAHAGRSKVLTLDIKSFFPSTTKKQVFNFFSSNMKCSPDVADILSDICTYDNHIPTGSRISMPLSFFANMDMFHELDKLGKRHSVKMTVYVDDISFSGDNVNKLLLSTVKSIVERYGHEVHPDKTTLYARDDAKVITGVVLSENGMGIMNKQHAKIHNDMVQWMLLRDTPSLLPQSLQRRLMGRLNSLSVVDSRLKDKAKSIQKYKPKSKSVVK